MKTLEWMAAASRGKLTLAKLGAATITITPGTARGPRGWTVRTRHGVTTVDAVRLEDAMEAWAFRGYREVRRERQPPQPAPAVGGRP